MRRKIKPMDANELIDADDINFNRTTMKGEMRKLWPAIHQKLTERGWSARDMVKWFDERGMSMSVELFRVYLCDLDKEQGYDRSSNEFNGISKSRRSGDTSNSTTSGSNFSSPSSTPSRANRKPEISPSIKVIAVKEGDESSKPAGMTQARWSEVRAKERAEKRKQKLNSGE